MLSSSFTAADQVGGLGGVAALALSTDTPLTTPSRRQQHHQFGRTPRDSQQLSLLEEASSARPLGAVEDFGAAGSATTGRSIEAFTPRGGVTFADERVPYSSSKGTPMGDPARSATAATMGTIPETTPGSAGSRALSEFSFMHDEEGGVAYISSPGHSPRSHGDSKGHSLSRSLSASFGQVSGKMDDSELDAKVMMYIH